MARSSPLVFLAVLATFPASSLLADAIWLVGSEQPLYTSARITRLEKGQLYFIVSGNETSRDVERVARLAVDDEPALTAAESAMWRQQWDDAVDGYEKVLRSAGKAWVRDWASTRLIDAAGKSGRFDSAVTAWLLLVQKDAASAGKVRPALPDSKSTYLETAAQQIERALSGRNLTDEQRVQMLAFLLEIQTARGQPADALAESLDELLAKDPNNPAAARANVRRKLESARAALAAGKFEQTEQAIQVSRAIFVEPADQAEALYLLAEARLGRAGADRTKLQDSAIAFMRVVVVGKDAPGRHRVADALARTAEICEKLGDPATAQRLYEEVIRDYPDSKQAPAARQAAERLKAAARN